jgi:hypothetical protein
LGALCVVAVVVLLLRRTGGGGKKAASAGDGGGRGRPPLLLGATTPAAQLTAALLQSASAAATPPERPAVLYPGLELDWDERGDDGEQAPARAASSLGRRAADDDRSSSSSAPPPPLPLLVSPAAVGRLRALATGLAPDEPDDDEDDGDSSSWPPARLYSTLLAGGGSKRGRPSAAARRRPRSQNPNSTTVVVDPPDPDAKSYLDPDGPVVDEMARQLTAVRLYLSSPEFARRQAERRATGPARGIVLNAGGPRLLASAIVLLTVLREHLNVTLPVELAWWGPEEMDEVTLRALERRFAPLRGYDLSTAPYPAHHRPLRASEAAVLEKGWGGAEGAGGGGGHHGPAPPPVTAGTPSDGLGSSSLLKGNRGGPPETGATRRRYAGKVFSLYASRFQRALVLDADCVPLSKEGLESLFDDPAFKRRGTLFFPDFWASSPGAGDDSGKRRAAELAGADGGASHRALSRGMAGLGERDSESGQLLVDLNRHADALEYLWWLNSYPEHTYRAVWGDKDTYAAALAGAGKAGAFAQGGVPPGALFAWRPRMLMRQGDGPKDKDKHLDGWMLLGMLQFAPRTGLPLFMHRTIDKFSADDGGRGGGAAAAAGAGAGAGDGAAATADSSSSSSSSAAPNNKPTTPPAPTTPSDDNGAAAGPEDLLNDPHHLPDHLRRRYSPYHPWPVQLATGPLPRRWVRYYLAQDPLGPTRGVPWDYVVPAWAVREWLPFPPAGSTARVLEAKAGGGSGGALRDQWQETGEGLLPLPPPAAASTNTKKSKRSSTTTTLTCPVATFVAYRRARELGLPVGKNATLDDQCSWVLRASWGGERWRAFSALGLDARPELMWPAARDLDAAAWSRPAPRMAAGGAALLKGGKGRRRRRRAVLEEEAEGGGGGEEDAASSSSDGLFSLEVGGPLPVAALRWDYAAPRVDSPTMRAVRAAYAAQRDIAPGGARRAEFPVLAGA